MSRNYEDTFMENEDKRLWGIHTQDDSLFLNGNVIGIG